MKLACFKIIVNNRHNTKVPLIENRSKIIQSHLCGHAKGGEGREASKPMAWEVILNDILALHPNQAIVFPS